MQRRKLLAVAGALSVGAFATTVGLGANFGLFDLAQPGSPAGRLDGSSTNAHVVRMPDPASTPTTATTAAPTTDPLRHTDGADSDDD